VREDVTVNVSNDRSVVKVEPRFSLDRRRGGSYLGCIPLSLEAPWLHAR